MRSEYYVEIIERLPGGGVRVERRLGPFPTERSAEKTERGVNINLNHESWFTRVVRTVP